MEQNNTLHTAIRQTFGSTATRIQGDKTWADFYVDGNRIVFTKYQRGFRIATAKHNTWKSSAKAACNFVAQNF